YLLVIQHPNNLVSVYKHNAELLKQTGNMVKAGEVIAIVGNSGEYTSGPHLHFELWHNGIPVNPEEYILF
ncbi:MAG TPA: M23 family metallopeptidase, partial [Bacteroidales bacterium]|nr:M23 family metallopeptidase [Bacteroidales bacterium]